MREKSVPKKGYKIVLGDFREEFSIPTDWEMTFLHKLCKKMKPGGTPKSDEKDFYGGDIPFTSIVDISNSERYLEKTIKTITKKGLENSNAWIIPQNSLLYSMYATVGKPVINKIDTTTHQGILGILVDKTKIDNEFLCYELENIRRKLVRYFLTNTQSNITLEISKNLKIIHPQKINEQQKISSILSNVDNLIQNTEKQIRKTKQLKKSLMQKLLIKGIGHTNFKNVNLGKKFLNFSIPKIWNVKKFGDILKINNSRIDIKDTEKYVRIIIKRRHEGVILRDTPCGKEILTKNQYRVETGQFVISRRQIIHNACGLIQKEFNNAIVSNEYSIFSGTVDLDINYFDLFSQSKIFKKTIVLTTQGVHIEKYIFLLDEWLQLSMPLPPLSEQQKIASILSNVDEKIQSHERYKEKLQRLKKSLMQKLLTGEVRVAV